MPISVATEISVSTVLEDWRKVEKNDETVRAARLLAVTFPKNKVFEEVYLKVVAVNSAFSTNILDCYTVAKHICANEIDERLESGDLSLVNEIESVEFSHKSGVRKKRRAYSFFSKYCSVHFPEKYPIYDSHVVRALMYYDKTGYYFMRQGIMLNEDLLRSYPFFVRVVNDFQQYSKLDLLENDAFLWQVGKNLKVVPDYVPPIIG